MQARSTDATGNDLQQDMTHLSGFEVALLLPVMVLTVSAILLAAIFASPLAEASYDNSVGKVYRLADGRMAESTDLAEQILLEAEDASGDGQVNARSNASGEKSVLLYSGESRSLEFTSTVSCNNVYGISVLYSNDHDISRPLETVSVSVDGVTIGQFDAENTRLPGQTPGEGWNEFQSSGVIGTALIDAGRHEIVVSVNSGDNFGVEIDVFILGLEDQTCLTYLPSVFRSIPPIVLEGESGNCDGPVMNRSNASNEETVWLQQEKTCSWTIPVRDTSQYTVEVRYSNDHDTSRPLETIEVIVDGTVVGQFEAGNTRLPGQSPGEGWNEFESSGLLGPVELETGTRDIILAVGEEGDGFGVEIDFVRFEAVTSE